MDKKKKASLHIEHHRNLYHFHQQNFFLRWLARGLVVILLLSIFLLYHLTHRQSALYYTQLYNKTSKQYHQKVLVPLTEPNQSNRTILRWGTDKVIRAYSLNFAKSQQQLDKLKPAFTSTGWTAFMLSISKNNFLKTILSKQLVLSAVVNGYPIIDSRGRVDGEYTWRVEMPILVTITSNSETITENYLVSMLIARVSTLRNPKGIEIARFRSTLNA